MLTLGDYIKIVSSPPTKREARKALRKLGYNFHYRNTLFYAFFECEYWKVGEHKKDKSYMLYLNHITKQWSISQLYL